MNKVLAVVLGAAGVLVAGAGGLVAVAAAQPDVLEVHREQAMKAGAIDVVPHLVDFEKFVKWSPWSELDPEQTVTFSSPPRGVGAWYRWKGNDEVGEGEMRVKAVSSTRVLMTLEFKEPFPARAKVPYTLTESEGQVTVDWGYRQELDLMGKVMGLFVDMDALLGADFEKGLARLQQVVEDEAQTRREAASAQDQRVTLQGTFAYKGSTTGVRRLLVQAEDGTVVAAQKLTGKSWKVSLPRSLGSVRVHAFIDPDRDGPTPGDPGALSPEVSLREGTPEPLVLRLQDDVDGSVGDAP